MVDLVGVEANPGPATPTNTAADNHPPPPPATRTHPYGGDTAMAPLHAPAGVVPPPALPAAPPPAAATVQQPAAPGAVRRPAAQSAQQRAHALDALRQQQVAEEQRGDGAAAGEDETPPQPQPPAQLPPPQLPPATCGHLIAVEAQWNTHTLQSAAPRQPPAQGAGAGALPAARRGTLLLHADEVRRTLSRWEPASQPTCPANLRRHPRLRPFHIYADGPDASPEWLKRQLIHVHVGTLDEVDALVEVDAAEGTDVWYIRQPDYIAVLRAGAGDLHIIPQAGAHSGAAQPKAKMVMESTEAQWSLTSEALSVLCDIFPFDYIASGGSHVAGGNIIAATALEYVKGAALIHLPPMTGQPLEEAGRPAEAPAC
eukprot:gene7595-4435_t